MASAQTGTSCANHRKRERVATCGLCNSALCIDCVVHTAVGVKCRKCTGGAAATAPTATAKARGVAAEEGKKQRRWAVPVAALGVLFIGIAAFAVINRDSGGGGGGSTEVATDGPSVSVSEGGSASVVDKKADFVGGGGLRIGASLSVPSSLGNRSAPGVLIVPGGGAQDRNGGIQLTTNLPDPLYQDLAEAFAQGGMVAMRYDRRGTGESQLGQGVPLTWDGLVADAKAGLKFLTERRETQGQPITVVGYDQGGFIAMDLANEPGVRGVVLISTPGRKLPEVIASDFRRGVPDPAKAQVVADAMLAAAAQVVETGVNPRPETLPEEVRLIFTADAPYLRGLFGFDPFAAASRVKVPTLLVRGGDDASIQPGDVERLQGAIPRADQLTSPFGGNTLALPPEREGRFHNPARHGTVRDGDALFAMTEWIKGNAK